MMKKFTNFKQQAKLLLCLLVLLLPSQMQAAPSSGPVAEVIWCETNKTLYFVQGTVYETGEFDEEAGEELLDPKEVVGGHYQSPYLGNPLSFDISAIWYGADVLNCVDDYPGWLDYAAEVEHVVIDSSFAIFRPKSCKEWFFFFENMQDITGLEYINTSQVTSMYGMFVGCNKLTSLDVSSFNTANVTNMGAMFAGCESLTMLDLSSFNTVNVYSMEEMFSQCYSLESVDASGFDATNVLFCVSMFYECSSLTTIDLTNFHLDIPQNIDERDYNDVYFFSGTYDMFFECSSLETIYCNNTWEPTTSTDMFAGCTSLVGEYGTEFSSSETDGSKANPGEEGYFTLSEEVLTARDGGDGWYYTTYYNGEHSRFVDNNTEVYVAWADWDNNSINLELNDDSVEKRLLKGHAFILRSKQPTITLSLCSNDGRPIGGGAMSINELEGSAKTEDVWGGGVDIYTLGRVGGVLGFYKYTGEMLNARKAFLWTMNEFHGGGAPLRISFDDETVTGIDTSTMDKVQSTGIYDLQGRRVALPTKGLYIVNGKKVFMK